MKNKTRSLDTSLFYSGEKLIINRGGQVKLPVDHQGEQEVLCIKSGNTYKLIPLVTDIKRVYIEVTTECNFSCITCIRHSWPDALCHMTWETFESIFESLKALPDLTSVHFGGFGEPMMHPEIFDMIEKVKSLGVQAEMITNGSYLTTENIEKLISVHLDILYTSLDSPDEESYNEIRIGADFKNVTDHIENLQAIKEKCNINYPKLGIEFVAMKKNFQSLPALISMAHQLKAFQIIVSNVIPYHISMADEILYDLDDSGVLFGKASLKTTLFAEVSHMKLRTERSCKFVEDKTVSINHLGEVSPCYALMHTYKCYIYGREKQIYPCHIGNVKDKSLASLWMDPGYVNFRETVKDSKFPSCTDCKSVEGCTYTESNEMDCWGNSPSCGDCLWARRIIACP